MRRGPGPEGGPPYDVEDDCEHGFGRQTGGHPNDCPIADCGEPKSSKPLLVGELNPYGGETRHALFPYPKGSAGHNLCNKVLGLTRREYLKRFDRVNLCSGKWGNYAAQQAALTIKWSEPNPRNVVLLGVRVARAFGYDYPPFTSMLAKGKNFLILPHPSGLCRIWNERGSYARAQKFLREHGVL